MIGLKEVTPILTTPEKKGRRDQNRIAVLERVIEGDCREAGNVVQFYKFWFIKQTCRSYSKTKYLLFLRHVTIKINYSSALSIYFYTNLILKRIYLVNGTNYLLANIFLL